MSLTSFSVEFGVVISQLEGEQSYEGVMLRKALGILEPNPTNIVKRRMGVTSLELLTSWIENQPTK